MGKTWYELQGKKPVVVYLLEEEVEMLQLVALSRDTSRANYLKKFWAEKLGTLDKEFLCTKIAHRYFQKVQTTKKDPVKFIQDMKWELERTKIGRESVETIINIFKRKMENG